MNWINNNYKIFVIVFIFISFITIMITAQDSQKSKPMTQLVGSSNDSLKEVIILWQMPEKAQARNIFLEQNIPLLETICTKHGYSLISTSNGANINKSLVALTNDVINPSAQQIEILAKSLTKISNAEVLAFFTHGFSDNNKNGIFLGCYVTEADADNVLAVIKRNDLPLYNYLFKAELQDSIDYHFNEPWTIMLNLDAITNKVIPVSSTMIDNGILYMNICHSDVFKNVFNNSGAFTVVSAVTSEKTDYLIKNFLYTISCMLGELDSNKAAFPNIKDSQIINQYLNINEAYSSGDMSSKSVIVIDPPSFNYDKTRSMLRSPHIEEVVIYNAKNEKDIYYHYEYQGKDKYNPTEPYPGEGILKIRNIDTSFNAMIKADFLKKQIPTKEEAKIKIFFSKTINNRQGDKNKVSVKLKFWVKEASDYKKYLLDVVLSEDLTDNASPEWIGIIDVTKSAELSQSINNKSVGVNLLVSYIDPQKSNKTWFLDADGDGKWTESSSYDGEMIDGKYYDNNHWLIFGDVPKFTVETSEISKLHLPLIKYGPPPEFENEQPLASDGFIVYPEEEYKQLTPCYTMLANNNVSATSCFMSVTKKITDDYMPAFYLNKELLQKAKSEAQKNKIENLPEGPNPVETLKQNNYPVYVVKITTAATGGKDGKDQCAALNAAGKDISSYRPFINLKLNNYKYVKGNGSRGENYPGSLMNEIDLSEKYDLYTVKDNNCDLLVSLPLKRIFDGNVNAYEGKNVLVLETTNGGKDSGREVYSSQSLEFIKSIEPPKSEGPVHGSAKFHRVSDPVSGFDNKHLAEWVVNRTSDPEKGGKIWNMAHNLLDLGPLPDVQPTSKASAPPKEQSAESDVPESEDTSDKGYFADWTPNRGWIQEHQLNVGYESLGCYFKKLWKSVDFAVMYDPKPVVSPAQICESWRISKNPNISCGSGELPPDNKILSVNCIVDKSIEDKKETQEDQTNENEDKKPENPQDNTNTSDNGNNNQDNKQPSPPSINNITAVKDMSAYNHVALKIDWSDADSDINIYSARVFLINPFHPGYYREVDISRDLEAGNISSGGCILRNIPEFKEGFFFVKVYVQDDRGLYTSKSMDVWVNFDKPQMSKPFDKDPEAKSVSTVLSDQFTPVSDWKITYGGDYTLIPIDRFSAEFTAYIPEQLKQGYSLSNFNLKVTDLVSNDVEGNLYADLYGPQVGVEYQEAGKLLVSNQLDIDLNSGGIDPYRTELNIDGFNHQGDYKLIFADGSYKITYPAYKLTEGDHTAYAKACDYDNNCTTSGTLNFRVAWPPEIYYFNYHSSKSGNAEYLEAKVWDSGKNLDPDGFELKIDGQVIPETEYKYNPDDKMFTYYPANPFSSGEHTATLIARDTTGLFDTETITFKSAGITNLILTDKIYRDIEGNGDGIINEGERIYLDLGVKNMGDALTQNTWGDLVSRSQYIKGIAEKTARYGFIQPGEMVYNDKPFEFVVNEKVFEREDIDRVEAEFVLQLRESDPYSSGKSKTTEIPFTLVIERMDPAMALFEISVVKPTTPTMEPALKLEGSWKTFGTDLRTLDIRITQDSLPAATARNSLSAFQKELTVIKNDAAKTFYADATLGVGENRFVVTAVADNGVVRTAEANVKLTSQVGIALDEIAETASPNVTVTGRAWTVNSKLESVEVYVNGGNMGTVPFDGDGRFSLPVTLNGGENIIRAVARDDQGKIATDEITVRMRGPLTIRWVRSNYRTTETPYAACGSYAVEGDDIATIVTYINGAPNNHEVTIDRNLKTFCTTFDLQPGNNLLRAVGTTTGGISSDAYSQAFYQTGGVLSIEFDPLPPQTTGSFTITGRYTLMNGNPYTISIWGSMGEAGWGEYIPIIDEASRTFSFTATLLDPPPGCGDGACCCETISNYFIGSITQDAELAESEFYADQINPVCTNGFTRVDDTLYTTGTGYIEGTFFLNVPGAHVSNMMIGVTDVDFNYHEFNIADYDETLGTWQVYVDVSPSHIDPTTNVYFSIMDTFGNNFFCFQDAQVFSGGKKIRLVEKNKIENKRNRNRNPERNKRQPKRTVDGN